MEETAFAERLAAKRPAARVFPRRYLSIISYKRDRGAVARPVWFVLQGGRLLVETDASSLEVKRIYR
jgi:hypothetical protein